MMKKMILIITTLCLITGASFANLLEVTSTVPNYMSAEFYNQFPNYAEMDLFQKVKHKPLTPEDYKHVPKFTNTLSSDGVEVININASTEWAPGLIQGQHETWMAINPTNPNNLIATMNDNYSLSGVGGWRMTSFYSLDGGKTWDVSFTPRNQGEFITIGDGGGGGTIFDPGVVFDSEGNSFYMYGFTQTGKEDPRAEQNGVFVTRSTNGGQNWTGWDEETFGFELPISPIALADRSSGNIFHDRYSIGVDDNASSPYQGHLYVSWKRFRGANDVVIARSTDGGFLWDEAISLQDGGNQAPMPVVGPEGEVYVCWLDRNGGSIAASVRKSTDGGASYGVTITAQEVTSIGTVNPASGRYTLTDKQGLRCSSTPQITVDKSDSEYRGNVYVVQAGKEPGTTDYGIFFARSTNGGLSWESNIRIDNNQFRNDLFFPSITCDPVTGTIAVFYYSSENDPQNNQGIDGIVAISKDGGDTWSHVNVSPNGETWYIDEPGDVFPQNFGGESGNVYWGDYTHIVSYNDNIFPLFWAPTRESNAFQSLDLFTALISQRPQPVENLVATNELSGDVAVRLNWDHPTTNLSGQSLVNFTIEIRRNGQLIGEVAGDQPATYLDETVEDGSVVTYELTVVDSDDRRSSPVSTQINVGGSRQPSAPLDLTWLPLPNGTQIKFLSPETTVDGEPLRDLEKFNLYIDGQLYEAIQGEIVETGVEITYDIEIETDKFYELYITAVGVRGGIETESEQTPTTFIYAGNPLTSLNETFDDPNNVIPFYAYGSDWGLTEEASLSGNFSFTDRPNEDYDRNQTTLINGMYTAPILVSNEMTTLSLDHIALLRTGDFGVIAITADYGQTHEDLIWVNEETSAGFLESDVAGSSWENRTFDISQYEGQIIMIHMGINSNAISQDMGWFIDNLTLDTRTVSVENQLQVSDITAEVYPNPMNEQGTLRLNIPNSGLVDIAIYDAIGNKVQDIKTQFMFDAGIQDIDFYSNELSNGVYYCQITLGNVSKTIPLVISR